MVNIWFVVNIDTRLCCEWRIKPYCLSGSDEEKTAKLKELAETDHITAVQFPIRKDCRITDGKNSIDGVLHLSQINSEVDLNFEHYLIEAEKLLPKQVQFPYDEEKRRVIRLRFDPSPLYVKTILMENLRGEVRPYTTEDNIAWIEAQRSPGLPPLF